ncbi:hypothetical protein RS030_4499 [Cryptosporidium xiaoi]|uniref:Uncharacterized protein n=1 Tax=Cryptosporidium xiaoi TaxID=659607 RepID=A0AAV9XV77_9CRYT
MDALPTSLRDEYKVTTITDVLLKFLITSLLYMLRIILLFSEEEFDVNFEVINYLNVLVTFEDGIITSFIDCLYFFNCLCDSEIKLMIENNLTTLENITLRLTLYEYSNMPEELFELEVILTNLLVAFYNVLVNLFMYNSELRNDLYDKLFEAKENVTKLIEFIGTGGLLTLESELEIRLKVRSCLKISDFKKLDLTVHTIKNDVSQNLILYFYKKIYAVLIEMLKLLKEKYNKYKDKVYTRKLITDVIELFEEGSKAAIFIIREFKNRKRFYMLMKGQKKKTGAQQQKPKYNDEKYTLETQISAIEAETIKTEEQIREEMKLYDESIENKENKHDQSHKSSTTTTKSAKKIRADEALRTLIDTKGRTRSKIEFSSESDLESGFTARSRSKYISRPRSRSRTRSRTRSRSKTRSRSGSISKSRKSSEAEVDELVSLMVDFNPFEFDEKQKDTSLKSKFSIFFKDECGEELDLFKFYGLEKKYYSYINYSNSIDEIKAAVDDFGASITYIHQGVSPFLTGKDYLTVKLVKKDLILWFIKLIIIIKEKFDV